MARITRSVVPAFPTMLRERGAGLERVCLRRGGLSALSRFLLASQCLLRVETGQANLVLTPRHRRFGELTTCLGNQKANKCVVINRNTGYDAGMVAKAETPCSTAPPLKSWRSSRLGRAGEPMKRGARRDPRSNIGTPASSTDLILRAVLMRGVSKSLPRACRGDDPSVCWRPLESPSRRVACGSTPQGEAVGSYSTKSAKQKR